MAALWNSDERSAIAAALDALVPGASDLGAVDYVENLLTALDYDPPRIWASPSAGWLEIGPWERHAWNVRIAEWRTTYDRIARGDELARGDKQVLHTHACEATYGDPAYGGNRDEGGWQRVNFPAPRFPPARSSS